MPKTKNVENTNNSNPNPPFLGGRLTGMWGCYAAMAIFQRNLASITKLVMGVASKPFPRWFGFIYPINPLYGCATSEFWPPPLDPVAGGWDPQKGEFLGPVSLIPSKTSKNLTAEPRIGKPMVRLGGFGILGAGWWVQTPEDYTTRVGWARVYVRDDSSYPII